MFETKSLIVSALIALAAPCAAADDAPFDRFDMNGDGVLTLAELRPDIGTEIIAALDEDQSGSVSRSEFAAGGRQIQVRSQTKIVCPNGSIDHIRRVVTIDLFRGTPDQISGAVSVENSTEPSNNRAAPCGIKTLEGFETHILPQLHSEF